MMEDARDSVRGGRLALSCVVPIYNVEKYLACCLESIVRQTHGDFECICIDDGSTDASAAIAREFCARDGRFRLIRQENRGLAAARNRGIEEARCPYVTFVDSDDYLHPTAFDVLLGIAVTSGADLVCCRYVPVAEQATFPKTQTNVEVGSANVVSAEPLLSVLRGFAPVGPSAWGKLYATSLLKRCTFDEGTRIHEDTWHSIQVLRSATRLACSEVPIYFYRSRPGSLTNSKSYEASLRSLVAAALQSGKLAAELRLGTDEKSRLLMLGGVEAFSMIAVEVALNRRLPLEEKERLLKVCASLVTRLRAEGILASVHLSRFLAWSMWAAYGMRMPKAYARTYHWLVAFRCALRRWTRRGARATAA